MNKIPKMVGEYIILHSNMEHIIAKGHVLNIQGTAVTQRALPKTHFINPRGNKTRS